MVNREPFDKEATIDDRGDVRKVEGFVRAVGHVRELGFSIAGHLGYRFWQVDDDSFANGWTDAGFLKALLEICFVTALWVVKGCSGSSDSYLQFFWEVCMAFSGWWKGKIIIMEVKRQGKVWQDESERAFAGGVVDIGPYMYFWWPSTASNTFYGRVVTYGCVRDDHLSSNKGRDAAEEATVFRGTTICSKSTIEGWRRSSTQSPLSQSMS